MRWISPPTRREITLLIFCLTIFTLAYNVDNSIRFLGFDASATQGAVLSRLGFGTAAILKDGRRPSGWRDALENTIYGTWEWKDGHVAAEEDGVGQPKGVGVHGAMWMSRKEMQATWSSDGPSANEGFRKWADDIPITRLVHHRPGHTVLEQAILFNGTVYLVTDTPEAFPNVNSIVYPRNEADNWMLISTQAAKEILGDHGGIIRGVSWMSADTNGHNNTLFELWSLHTQQNLRKVAWPHSPQRIFFPATPVFSDPDPDRNLVKEYWLRRVRSDTGFHPYTLKSAFPSLTVLFKDDWNDYRNMEVPFIMERLIVVDNEVSSEKLSLENLPHNWWEPIRSNMIKFLDSYQPLPSKHKRWGWKQKKTITYIHRQDARRADSRQGRLADDSHEALLHALENFAKDYSVNLNIVSALDGDAAEGNNWSERMRAVVKSDVVLGVHGPHLLDAAFMKPSPETAVLEFFSPGTASRDRESIINALGMKYHPWWTNRKPSLDEFAYAASPEPAETSVDVHPVLKELRAILGL